MPDDIFALNNKIALVTGASRGIGRDIALALADKGAHVIVSSRKIDDCQVVVNEITQRGGSAEALSLHIGSMDAIEAAFRYIKQHFAKLDILVNNAAANPYFGPIEDTPIDAFQKTLDVNIRGYFYMTTNAIKIMKTGTGGSIINIASVNGVSPGPWQGIYSVTKAAVINMTKAFARECATDQIRVNALLPGLTKTKFAGAITENKEILSKIPIGRAAKPVEMAGAAVYLASDAASYTTGTAINVDGGLLS